MGVAEIADAAAETRGVPAKAVKTIHGVFRVYFAAALEAAKGGHPVGWNTDGVNLFPQLKAAALAVATAHPDDPKPTTLARGRSALNGKDTWKWALLGFVIGFVTEAVAPDEDEPEAPADGADAGEPEAPADGADDAEAAAAGAPGAPAGAVAPTKRLFSRFASAAFRKLTADGLYSPGSPLAVAANTESRPLVALVDQIAKLRGSPLGAALPAVAGQVAAGLQAIAYALMTQFRFDRPTANLGHFMAALPTAAAIVGLTLLEGDQLAAASCVAAGEGLRAEVESVAASSAKRSRGAKDRAATKKAGAAAAAAAAAAPAESAPPEEQLGFFSMMSQTMGALPEPGALA